MANWLSIRHLQKVLPRLYAYVPYSLMPKRAFPPLHAYFEVTYRCNLRCDMCHFLEIIEDTENNKTYKNELTSEQIQKTIRGLPRFSVITFTGGEAFMKSDFMDILRFTANRNKVHVITNGTTLNEATVDQLMEMRLRSWFGSGLFFLGVSMEGREEFHDQCTTIPGSFRKTTRGVELFLNKRRELKSKYPLVHLTCVINKDNVGDLVYLYDYAEELGMDVCNFVLKNPATYWHAKDYDQEAYLRQPTPPVEEIDPAFLRGQLEQMEEKSRTYKAQLRYSPNYINKEEIIRYYSNQSSYKDYRCYSPWAKVGISAYGDVFSCPHHRAGNVQDNGAAFPWNTRKYGELRQELKKEKIFPGCLGCCQSEYVGK